MVKVVVLHEFSFAQGEGDSNVNGLVVIVEQVQVGYFLLKLVPGFRGNGKSFPALCYVQNAIQLDGVYGQGIAVSAACHVNGALVYHNGQGEPFGFFALLVVGGGDHVACADGVQDNLQLFAGGVVHFHSLAHIQDLGADFLEDCLFFFLLGNGQVVEGALGQFLDQVAGTGINVGDASQEYEL